MANKWSKASKETLAGFVTPDIVNNYFQLPNNVNPHDLVQTDKKKLVEIIYDTLVEKNLKYTLNLFSSENATQLIRSYKEIFKTDTSGTCLDLAILFCGICLKFDLLPLLILLEDHAFVAVSMDYCRRDWKKPERKQQWSLIFEKVLENHEEVKELVKSGRFLPIECTGFVHTETVNIPQSIKRNEHGFFSFDTAVKAGYKLLNIPIDDNIKKWFEEIEITIDDIENTNAVDEKPKKLWFAIDVVIAQERWGIETITCSPDEEYYISIDEYLKKEIKKKVEENVLDNERLTFEQIYVSLQATKVNAEIKNSTFDLEEWAEGLLSIPKQLELELEQQKPTLENSKLELQKLKAKVKKAKEEKLEQSKLTKLGSELQKSELTKLELEKSAKNIEQEVSKQLSKVLFVQGGPGRGKSVFCRMFANRTQNDTELGLTPILIRLRDIDNFEGFLEEILQRHLSISYAFAKDKNWLEKERKFLFILDGFDELIIQNSRNESIKAFINKVEAFQRQYGANKKHRTIITGRAMALHGISLPGNLERVEIADMNSNLQKNWFDKWYNVFSETNRNFQQFLQDQEKCPPYFQELAREPLLLYMLVAMYYDGMLNIDRLKNSEKKIKVKVEVYNQALEWVLQKQRYDQKRDINLTEKLTNLKQRPLELLLAEAAIAITQSGREYVDIERVKDRLSTELAEILLQQAKVESGVGNPLSNALAAFYIKSNGDGGVEFFHKSFREYFSALRIKQSLESWAEEENRDNLNKEIYDLLGYGGLTQEIVEYIFGLLDESKENEDKSKQCKLQIFDKLKPFYESWCNGNFIDSPKNNLALDACQKYDKYEIKLGARAVDIYTGLNVMILLLELHRKFYNEKENKKIFYPSGEPKEGQFTTQLTCVINYSNCIQPNTFLSIVGNLLTHADLTHTDLTGANFASAKLNWAKLNHAKLNHAKLNWAKLDHAKLNHADLSRADLTNANLTSAKLANANLTSAELANANLINVSLIDANLAGANLDGANLAKANLNRANLNNTKLTNAILTDAILADANLAGANLAGANLAGANLTGANLAGVNFKGTKNLTPEQVKAAKNWYKAEYYPEFRQQLYIL